MRRWGWQAAAGWIFWFTGLEPAGSDRLDRVVLSKGSAIEFKDGVSLGAPALDCVAVCAKEGDGLAGRREVLTQPGEHRAEVVSGCGLGKAFQAMATLVNS